LSTSKIQYASNVTNGKEEDARCAEPDPSLRPFFQFLLNSTKRKKRDPIRSPDRRLVEDFVSHSINDLRNPIRGDPLGPIPLDAPGAYAVSRPSHEHRDDEHRETEYLPVPIFTRVPRPKPVVPVVLPRPDIFAASAGSLSGAAAHQTSAPNPYAHWQETPLIFPNSHRKPVATTRPAAAPSSSNHYHRPGYGAGPVLADDQPPTFVTPVQLRPPAFVTPVEHQGPTFVPPISVAQAPPPTIVILEDIDTADDADPQSDPAAEQDDAGGAAAGTGGGPAAAAGAGIAAAAGAGAAAIAGIAGGSASAAAAAAGAGGGGGTPADVVQCRSSGGGSASKVCSELITTTTSSASSGSSWFFLDGLITLFTSLNFFAPLALTFWSMLFPPMSVILASGLGVVSLLFPWLLPRIFLGRQLGSDFSIVKPLDERLENANNHHQPYYY